MAESELSSTASISAELLPQRWPLPLQIFHRGVPLAGDVDDHTGPIASYVQRARDYDQL